MTSSTTIARGSVDPPGKPGGGGEPTSHHSRTIAPRRAEATPFAQKVEVHDSLQVEIKRDYPIDWDDRPGAFSVDAFLFVPRAFGVAPATTTKDELLALMNTLYRWREDARRTAEIAAPDDHGSPLAHVEVGLRKIMAGNGGLSRPLAREARRAGGIARAFLKERGAELIARLDELEERAESTAPGGAAIDPAAAASLRDDVAQFLDQVESLLRRFRDVHVATQQAAVALHPDLVEAVHLVDEHATAKAEGALARIVVALDRASALQDGRGGRAALAARARALARDVSLERTRAGFTTVGATPIEAERFAFKQSLLKKYTDRPLYLTATVERGDIGKLRHAIGAFAAALGASWALIAQTATQQFTVASALTGVIAFLAVLAYMVKDRIKDLVKEILTRYLRSYIPDRAVLVIEPARESSPERLVANVVESVRFLEPREVGADVLAARALGHSVDVGPERDEEVILFHRAIDCAPAHGLGLGPMIREAQRLEVSSLLERLDDPEQRFFHYDARTDGAVVESAAAKVYHLNIVFRIQPKAVGEAPRYSRTRVVLTKRGIARVEEALPLETPEQVAARLAGHERAVCLKGLG